MRDFEMELDSIESSNNTMDFSEICYPLGLDKEALAQLNSIVKHHYTLEPGEHLFRSNARCKSIFAVKAGCLKSYKLNLNDEQVLGFHFPQDIFGFEAFNQEQYLSAVVALERSDVCEIPLESLESTCSKESSFRRQIHRLIGQEFLNDHKLLLLMSKKTGEGKLASFILNMSQRFQERGYSQYDFNLPMSRSDIGNFLGLADETVSRIFSRFQNDNLLTINRKRITIYDIDRLTAMVQ